MPMLGLTLRYSYIHKSSSGTGPTKFRIDSSKDPIAIPAKQASKQAEHKKVDD